MFWETFQNNVQLFIDGRYVRVCACVRVCVRVCVRACVRAEQVLQLTVDTGRYFDSPDINTAEMKLGNSLL